jgi:ABC-type dipeptide/oligopeptide/nickel transport system permease component
MRRSTHVLLVPALLETLGEDYIRTARAKGVGERVVFFKHTLRAVLAPLITSGWSRLCWPNWWCNHYRNDL